MMNINTDIPNRIVSFDMLKLFAMFLVIWGHCMQQFIPEYGNTDNKLLFTYIYSFHMPLFMMISGYFSLRTFKEIDIANGVSVRKLWFGDMCWWGGLYY